MVGFFLLMPSKMSGSVLRLVDSCWVRMNFSVFYEGENSSALPVCVKAGCSDLLVG